MRGKVRRCRFSSMPDRITPAYAGKSSSMILLVQCTRDHPRLCGEKFHNAYNSPLWLGSPPPMRGKAHKSSGTAFSIRITPAYAGKSFNFLSASFAMRDHPRLCGEKWKHRIFLRYYKGSPPPMRGKAKTDLFDFFEIRITPAYAGKSTISAKNKNFA